jgi:hypothetical protein
MAQPTVYKTFTKQDIEERFTSNIDSSDKTKINSIVSNFITYFKAKHS